MPRLRFRLEVSREGLKLEVEENFWDNTVVDAEGTTQLDHNISTVLQEIRTVLYYLGTDRENTH